MASSSGKLGVAPLSRRPRCTPLVPTSSASRSCVYPRARRSSLIRLPIPVVSTYPTSVVSMDAAYDSRNNV